MTSPSSFSLPHDHGFVPVIGLEIHAQILSASKLFSGASAHVFGKEPNTVVAFLDAGFPGTLPVVNQHCIEQGIRTGLGLQGRINMRSVFERKNYFYPDLPSGYQISQYLHPLMEEGHLIITGDDGTPKKIRIQRLHLEQDAGKNIHDKDPRYSYVDLNRSGVGLMEIVSHPDMSTPDEAVKYAKKLRGILRYLGTCDGNMEEGSMRVDANISVHKPGTPLGIRAELKNINSFRFLQQALVYEIQRQIHCVLTGQPLIQETRGFDVKKGVTVSLREKEDAFNYRYFPDPDLPELVLSHEDVDTIRKALPELPQEKFSRFQQDFYLTPYDAELLIEDLDVATFFEEAARFLSKKDKNSYKLLANWITGELFASLNKSEYVLSSMKVTHQHVAQLVDAIEKELLSHTLAKEVWAHMWDTGASPEHIMTEKNLVQVSDEATVLTWVTDALSGEEKNIALYHGGQEKLWGYFIGKIMKNAKGRGNPKVIHRILTEYLLSQK